MMMTMKRPLEDLGFDEEDNKSSDWSWLEDVENDAAIVFEDNQIFSDVFEPFEEVKAVSDGQTTLASSSSTFSSSSSDNSDNNHNYEKRKKLKGFREEPNLATSSFDIMKMCRLTVNAFNSGDMDSLRRIIDEGYEENCSVYTNAMGTELFGKHHIYNMFESLQRCIPDYCIFVKSSKFNKEKGIMIANALTSGTRQFSDSSQHMYFNDTPAATESLGPQWVKKMKSIEEKGGLAHFVCETTWFNVLNESRTKSNKVIFLQKHINVTEVPIPTTTKDGAV